MKKGFVSGFLAGLVALTLVVTAFAAVEQVQATLTYRDIKITMNGTEFTPKDVNGNVVEPFLISGTTYLPVRAVSGMLGLDVAWDDATSTVSLTDPDVPLNPQGYGRSNPAPIGVAQTHTEEYYDGTGNTVTLQILESTRGEEAEKMVLEASQFAKPAPEGKEYVVVKIRATVVESAEDASVGFDTYNTLQAFTSEGVEYEADYMPGVIEPQFYGRVYAGGSLEGYARYLVDEDDPAPRFAYGLDWDGTGGIWFSMT